MNATRRSEIVMYYTLYLWLTISHNQQVFHLPVTMELFQCIASCFPSCYRCLLVLIVLLNVVVPGFTWFFFVFLNRFLQRFSCEIDSQGGNCCLSQPSAEYWGVFWSVKILMERWCFLQHMYKHTDSGIIGLSDGKESSSFKCLSHVTMIQRFCSVYAQEIISKEQILCHIWLQKNSKNNQITHFL